MHVACARRRSSPTSTVTGGPLSHICRHVTLRRACAHGATNRWNQWFLILFIADCTQNFVLIPYFCSFSVDFDVRMFLRCWF
jgi:hypothetical protein